MKEELQEGSSYLIKWGASCMIVQMTVLKITGMAYQFKYENGTTAWIEKIEFERDARIIENISDFMTKNAINDFMKGEFIVEYETCPICHGMGTVPDSSSTAGNKSCPLCNGNKRVVKNSK